MKRAQLFEVLDCEDLAFDHNEVQIIAAEVVPERLKGVMSVSVIEGERFYAGVNLDVGLGRPGHNADQTKNAEQDAPTPTHNKVCPALEKTISWLTCGIWARHLLSLRTVIRGSLPTR